MRFTRDQIQPLSAAVGTQRAGRRAQRRSCPPVTAYRPLCRRNVVHNRQDWKTLACNELGRFFLHLPVTGVKRSLAAIAGQRRGDDRLQSAARGRYPSGACGDAPIVARMRYVKECTELPVRTTCRSSGGIVGRTGTPAEDSIVGIHLRRAGIRLVGMDMPPKRYRCHAAARLRCVLGADRLGGRLAGRC